MQQIVWLQPVLPLVWTILLILVESSADTYTFVGEKQVFYYLPKIP